MQKNTPKNNSLAFTVALGTASVLFLLDVFKRLIPPRLKEYANLLSSIVVTAKGLKILINGMKLIW